MNKQVNLFLGLDVGGTNIRAGTISKTAELIGKIYSSDSPSNETEQNIVKQFKRLASELISARAAEGFSIDSCGIGMPGPFDYEQGISHMKHKYQAIYGINLKATLENELGMPTFFLNDACAFGLGVQWVEHPDKKKILALTLGTGFGSSFVTVENSFEHATDGELWNRPYKDGILEDYISRRAIERQYKATTGTEKEVKEIAEYARNKDAAALDTFSDLANNIGEGLAGTVKDFQPNIVVFGGKIGTHAFDLFGKQAEEIYTRKTGQKVPFVPTKNEFLGIFGAARFAMTKSSQQ